MSDNVDIKSYFKGITGALLGAVAAVLGIFVVGFFKDYHEANPFYASIMLWGSFGIDVLGAVIPLIAGLVCALLFIKLSSFPLRRLAVTLATSVLFAFLLCHPTDEGIAGYPLLFSLLVSVVATAVNVYPKPFVDLRKNLFAALTLTLFCVPLSLLVVDLFYLPSFAGSVIGGNGLSDGILVSTLYASFDVVAVFSALAYVSQTVWLFGRYRAAKVRTSKQ